MAMKLRKEVDQFAAAMEQRLRQAEKNVGWSWKDCDVNDLLRQFHNSAKQLDKEVYEGVPHTEEETIELLAKAADVGNMAMMIWDRIMIIRKECIERGKKG